MPLRANNLLWGDNGHPVPSWFGMQPYDVCVHCNSNQHTQQTCSVCVLALNSREDQMLVSLDIHILLISVASVSNKKTENNLSCLFHAVAPAGQRFFFKYSEDVLFVDMSVLGWALVHNQQICSLLQRPRPLSKCQ